MNTPETDTDEEAIRDAMLTVIRKTLLASPVPRGNARGAASMEIKLEAALGVAVTVSLPRAGGALIRVHGADRTRRFEWVSNDDTGIDELSSLDVPARA